jgi:hypothetical protein
MAAARKPKGPEALVLHLGGEEFALTALIDVPDDDGTSMKVPVPSLAWLDQLTFGEQLEVRRIARDLSGEKQGDWSDFDLLDLAPALITVVNQRTDDKFTVEDAKKLNWEKATARPPKAA